MVNALTLYQIRVLTRAISNDRGRRHLADEVDLTYPDMAPLLMIQV